MKRSKEHELDDWDILENKIVLDTRVVTVHAGPVRCKRSGRENEFYRFVFPDWVNIVALTPDNDVILIRQYRYGTNRMEIEIPGGMIDKREPPVEAGCRELLEETGYRGENARLIGKVCPNPALQDNYCYTVMVENAVKVAEPSLDDMEDIECMLMPESEVMQQVFSGRIEHGLVMNAFMFYLNRHNSQMK